MCDALRIMVDGSFAHVNYCTNKMMQGNEGVAPWEREMLAPRLDLPACKWLIDFWHCRPWAVQETIHTFTSFREFNFLQLTGIPIWPIPEEYYSICYNGTWDQNESNGVLVMRKEMMNKDTWVCVYVYRAESE
jgi:hypothetical protein